MSDHYLQHMFAPRSVAVVGASARVGSLGHAVLANLREGGFKGALYAVNPKYGGGTIDGIDCYKSLAALPQAADLAVVVTPAWAVASVLHDAARVGTGHAVVLHPVSSPATSLASQGFGVFRSLAICLLS